MFALPEFGLRAGGGGQKRGFEVLALCEWCFEGMGALGKGVCWLCQSNRAKAFG